MNVYDDAGFLLDFVLFLVVMVLVSACVVANIPEDDTPDVTETKTFNIKIPEALPICVNNEDATRDKPCYEENCGKYWSMYPEDEQRAIMERIDCAERNEAVLIYYLDLNRTSAVYMQQLLKDGI